MAPAPHAMETRLGNEDKMPKMILNCMWELQPHNSSSGQAPQHYTYNVEIRVLSQTSSWQHRVDVLHWEGTKPWVHIWQEVTRRYEDIRVSLVFNPFTCKISAPGNANHHRHLLCEVHRQPQVPPCVQRKVQGQPSAERAPHFLSGRGTRDQAEQGSLHRGFIRTPDLRITLPSCFSPRRKPRILTPVLLGL